MLSSLDWVFRKGRLWGTTSDISSSLSFYSVLPHATSVITYHRLPEPQREWLYFWFLLWVLWFCRLCEGLLMRQTIPGYSMSIVVVNYSILHVRKWLQVLASLYLVVLLAITSLVSTNGPEMYKPDPVQPLIKELSPTQTQHPWYFQSIGWAEAATRIITSGKKVTDWLFGHFHDTALPTIVCGTEGGLCCREANARMCVFGAGSLEKIRSWNYMVLDVYIFNPYPISGIQDFQTGIKWH